MRVLLVCSGGMSSAIVVKAIQDTARKQGLELFVKSIGTGEYEDEIRKGWDAALVAPQVRHRLAVFEKTAREFGVAIAVMSPQAYSPLGGPMALQELKKLFEQGRTDQGGIFE